MTLEEHQINLFARYEQRLLSASSSRNNVIPAVIITGFLGSGKTTLVQHILRNRGSLRIAVLVNEVGQLDVDSDLVNAKQGNAALGLAAADLSGGCVCCSRAGDLTAALRRIRAPAAAPSVAPTAAPAGGAGGGAERDAPCDYLLVETSGAADAGPLAEALVAGGFRLDAVVAVVDAEAGRQALELPVARAQIACADLVVINKCDLVINKCDLVINKCDLVINKCDLVMGPAPSPGLWQGPGPSGCAGGDVPPPPAAPPAPRGLGALADLEDVLAEMAPGVRVVRARFGEVPLTAVLDVEPLGPDPATTAAGAAAGGGLGLGGGGGNGSGKSAAEAAGGFVSHEAVPSGGSVRPGGGYRLAAGPLTADGLAVGSSRHTSRRAAAAPTATKPSSTSADLPPHPHSHHPHNQHHHHSHSSAHLHSGNPSHPRVSTSAGSHPPGAGSGDLPHAHLHSGFHTESVTADGGPCSLVAFADFVVRHLVREPALLRSKGVMWFGEGRSHRFTFHLSGRRRVECCSEGPWEGPPATHLVLIGTDPWAMRRLRDCFMREVVLLGPTQKMSAAASASNAMESQVDVQERGDEGPGDRTREEPPRAGNVGTAAETELSAAAAAVEAIAVNDKLHVLEALPWGASSREPAAGEVPASASRDPAAPADKTGSGTVANAPAPGRDLGSDGVRGVVGAGGDGGDCHAGRIGNGRLVHFAARGSLLHGINAEELNAELMRRANATGRVMVVGVTAPGKVSSVTNVQAGDRVLSLLLPLAAQPEEARRQAESLVGAAEPLLRRAYAHVTNCKCDVVGAMAMMKQQGPQGGPQG